MLLTCCKNTLLNINYASKIDNPDSMRAVVDKLPYDLRKRWRNRADTISEVQNRDIKFDDIVDFVDKEARAVAHPIFGDISGSRTQPSMRDSSVRPKKSFITTANTQATLPKEHSPAIVPGFIRPCVICGTSDHVIEDCVKFKGMTVYSRLDLSKSNKLCFNCLIPYHCARDCRKHQRCSFCSKKHAMLLHQDVYKTNEDNTDSNVSAIVGRAECSTSSSTECIGLPIVPVKVKDKNGELIVIHAFLDNGSNMSFCSRDLQDQLGIEGQRSKFFLTTLDKRRCPSEGDLLSVQVLDFNEELDPIELPSVMCRSSLPISTSDIPRQEDIDRWPYLHGLRIPDREVPVGLLIGNDNPTILEPLEVINSEQGGPYAVKTIMGWTINGPLGRYTSKMNNTVNFVSGDTTLSQQFHEYCNHEFQESLADMSTTMSKNDVKAMQIMDDTTQLDNGHYEMELPMKESVYLPDNKIMADHRLYLLKKRLTKDSDMHQRYTTFMNSLFEKGYAEVIPNDCVTNEDGLLWYLPHHPVTHPKKPDKLRVVFDCAAQFKNVSLNDQLLQGPDFTNTLIGVLLRFRKSQVAMIADVESMFHQVHVSPHHRDLLRFLWWKNGIIEETPQLCRMKVHIFGAKSSPSCCSYALKRTASDNKEDFDDLTIKTVTDNFYVDDCLVSVDDEEIAMQLSKQLMLLLAKGGFHLTKWTSNSARVIESILRAERATGLQSIDISSLGEAPVERALGVQWNIYSDQFRFQVMIKERPATRRGILSIMSSVYDPLGFVAPILLPVKKLLQDLCRLGLNWDDQIPTEAMEMWTKWLVELSQLEDFAINRCVKPKMGDIVSCEIHHFCDASELGYGSVAYLRLVDSVDKITVSFLIGKSRVTPLKSVSIPRLELAAATLSVRLDSLLRKEFDMPVTRSVFWTDSTAVLKFIRNEDRRFHTYVANRLAIIHDGSTKSDWIHIDTRLNPADDASRGVSVDCILQRPRWQMGPGYLQQPELEWPEQPDDMEPIDDNNPEVKKTYTTFVIPAVDQSLIEHILLRYSSWYKLRRCVAWLLRYKNNLQEAVRLRRLHEPVDYSKHRPLSPFSVSELLEAERHMVRDVQNDNIIQKR